jgi:hypothetical protein
LFLGKNLSLISKQALMQIKKPVSPTGFFSFDVKPGLKKTVTEQNTDKGTNFTFHFQQDTGGDSCFRITDYSGVFGNDYYDLLIFTTFHSKIAEYSTNNLHKSSVTS